MGKNSWVKAFIPSVQKLHFVGIGGIGMSGIAEVLHNLGYLVSGSDTSDNRNIQRLRALGIYISIGHEAEHVEGAHVVITSSAVKPTNPEVLAARDARIPVIPRAEMLAEIMRLKKSVAISGTHGKTTTTSMMAALWDAAGLDPTVINGGILNAYSTNARLGEGMWCVVEADESDGSFVKLPATMAVVTNMDLEHMEHYHTPENLYAAYRQFVQQIPFYGLAILCADHPVVKEQLIGSITDRRVVTYGLDEGADVRALNIKASPAGSHFDIQHVDGMWRDIYLPMVGSHNVQNALSVVAAGLEVGVEEETVRQALGNFKGVERRFTFTGEVEGVTIIDDYAHHPVEIKTVIKAARQATDGKGRVIVVVQPHRYSRLGSLFGDFSKAFDEADGVIVAPVYSAGEDPLPGVNSKSLATSLKDRGLKLVLELEDPEDLPSLVNEVSQSGDYVVCMGAGSITQWAHRLPDHLRSLNQQLRRA